MYIITFSLLIKPNMFVFTFLIIIMIYISNFELSSEKNVNIKFSAISKQMEMTQLVNSDILSMKETNMKLKTTI
jgi:hypothetical protein